MPQSRHLLYCISWADRVVSEKINREHASGIRQRLPLSLRPEVSDFLKILGTHVG